MNERETWSPSSGVLSVWNDIDEDIRDIYEYWYLRDHLRDRLNVPGFVRACRYIRIAGAGREFFTYYIVSSAEVLASEAYRARLEHATELTQKVMPHFRRLLRASCASLHCIGDGVGGISATLAMSGLAGEPRQKFLAKFADLMDSAIPQGNLTCGRVWRGLQEITDVQNAEADLRPDAPLSAELIVVIEGTMEKPVATALAQLTDAAASLGAGLVMAPTIYRLMYSSAV
jgi:hypothetical protein